jgi:hypothetical protein
MIPASILLWTVQTAAAPPPPVAVNRLELAPIKALSWTCQVSSTDRETLMLSGEFPAISVASQKDGGAFRLRTSMQSAGHKNFTGEFAAAMTGGIAGMNHYSIMVPSESSQIPAYVLTFELFESSKSGFVNVSQFDASSGAPTAYASGLCTMQAKQ